MKTILVYVLALVMVLGCLAGCGRNEPMEELRPTHTPVATTAPVTTARPTQKPVEILPDEDGTVNDGNGILEDNDGNNGTKPNYTPDVSPDASPNAAKTPVPDVNSGTASRARK